MLKKLLYVLLCALPLFNMAMEESWISSNPSATANLFSSIRGALKEESPEGIIKPELEQQLINLEKKYFKMNKINMTAYEHYSKVSKILAQLNNAAQYKGAVATVLAQYYWNQYGPELMSNNIYVFSQHGLQILAENTKNASELFFEWIMGKKEPSKEELTISGFYEVKSVVPSITHTGLNQYGPILKNLQTLNIPSGDIFSVMDDSIYVKNRKFDGYLIADEVFFIAGINLNNGESDIDYLQKTKKLPRNINENSFEQKNNTILKASKIFVLIDNIEACKREVAKTSSLFSFSNQPTIISSLNVQAKKIVINTLLVSEIQNRCNNCSILNIKNKDNSYATIDIIEYKEFKEEIWQKNDPQIQVGAQKNLPDIVLPIVRPDDYPKIEAVDEPEIVSEIKTQEHQDLPPEIVFKEKVKKSLTDITPKFLEEQTQELSGINLEINKKDKLTDQEHKNIDQQIGHVASAIKQKIDAIKNDLYDVKTKTFSTDNCMLLLEISDYINTAAVTKVNIQDNLTKQDKLYFMMEMGFGPEALKNQGLAILSDQSKSYFFIIPNNAMEIFGQAYNVKKTDYGSASQRLFIGEIEKILTEIFENKIKYKEPSITLSPETQTIYQFIENHIDEYDEYKAEVNKTIANGLYDDIFDTKNCTDLLSLSMQLDTIAQNMFQQSIKTPQDKDQLLFEILRHGKILIEEDKNIAIIRSNDNYFFIIPTQALHMLKTIRRVEKNRRVEKKDPDYHIINLSKDELKTNLEDIFNNKFKQEHLILTAEEIKNYAKNDLSDDMANRIKYTLSGLARKENISQNTGTLLMELSNLINRLVKTSKDSKMMQKIMNEIGPDNTYGYAKKFVSLKSNDDYYFLVPANLVADLSAKWKKFTDNTKDFLIDHIYANKDVLETALNATYLAPNLGFEHHLKNASVAEKKSPTREWSWNPVSWFESWFPNTQFRRSHP